MLTDRQKAKIRKQNQENDKKFVESLNAEEKELRAKYMDARDKADKVYADFFAGKATSDEFDRAESKKEECQKAFFGLVIRNRAKAGKSKPVKAPAAPKAKPARKDKSEKPTYTVMGETFATLKEAKAAAKIVRDRKPCEIKESNKKPTHKVVSFIAKSK